MKTHIKLQCLKCGEVMDYLVSMPVPPTIKWLPFCSVSCRNSFTRLWPNMNDQVCTWCGSLCRNLPDNGTVCPQCDFIVDLSDQARAEENEVLVEMGYKDLV